MNSQIPGHSFHSLQRLCLHGIVNLALWEKCQIWNFFPVKEFVFAWVEIFKHTWFPTIKELLEWRHWNASANYNQLSVFFSTLIIHFLTQKHTPIRDRMKFACESLILVLSVLLTDTKPKSSSTQYANLQRTDLLYEKGAFYAPLTCCCLYLIPRGRKYPHKYRGLSAGWTQEQGTLF